jgi:nucleoside-diphosphate-sugar epimerase
MLFASSREVYGNPVRLPVREDDAMLPVNIYGRSKRDGELIINQARKAGLLANICRFSNVYGCPYDHEDRAAMAFASKAVHGGAMRLNGGGNIFDFTHVSDVADGIWRLIVQTKSRRQMPPIHFASGKGTSLRELAELAATHALLPVKIFDMPARDFDVSGFVGDPSRAVELLEWRSRIPLEEGLARLIGDISVAGNRSACHAIA